MIEKTSVRKREPSMEDVAAEAGVSAQTVSRVVNNRGYVGAATRVKVQQAMAQLGYRPNSAARALRSGRFRTIGVITFSLTSYGNMRTLDAIATRASASEYAITLLPIEGASQSTVTGAFHRLSEHAVDGIIIIIEAHELDHAELEIPDGMPVVVIDSTKRQDHGHVDTDQAQGARLATEHLLALGHRTVHHICGPSESFAAERRRTAWEATLAAAGVAAPPVHVGDWSARSGYAAAVTLRDDPAVTAIFAANDAMALGAMRAFQEVGLSVPEHVSIMGFDDLPDAEFAGPALTTIAQDFDTVGATAVEALLTELSGGTVATLAPVPTRLVVRASTAAPRRT